ncbi:TPA: DUF1837 domain-containing protein [Acinetobacter baumannii]
MDNLDEINWESLRSGEHGWVSEHLIEHQIIEKDKFLMRLHSVDFSGTQQDLTALIDSIADSIDKYVFDSKQRERFKQKGVNAFRKAVSFFGETNPDMDGKYGELFLYILAEAVLKTPLVSHKLSILTNPNDQVKGGDGIFFGRYKDDITILIGESKIHQNFSGALESSLDSLDRFHQNYTSSTLDHELFIARSNISQNFSIDQLDTLLDAFTPGTKQYKSCNKAHPVLLVFESNEISNIEKKAKNRKEAEELFSIWAIKRIEKASKLLIEKLEKYSELEKIYLDIFLIPLNNVSSFKHSLYKAIHGIEYKSQE